MAAAAGADQRAPRRRRRFSGAPGPPHPSPARKMSHPAARCASTGARSSWPPTSRRARPSAPQGRRRFARALRALRRRRLSRRTAPAPAARCASPQMPRRRSLLGRRGASRGPRRPAVPASQHGAAQCAAPASNCLRIGHSLAQRHQCDQGGESSHHAASWYVSRVRHECAANSSRTYPRADSVQMQCSHGQRSPPSARARARSNHGLLEC